jgi:hypothetical protein
MTALREIGGQNRQTLLTVRGEGFEDWVVGGGGAGSCPERRRVEQGGGAGWPRGCPGRRREEQEG